MKDNVCIKNFFKDPKNNYLKKIEHLGIFKMLKIGKFNLRPSLIKINKLFIEIQKIYNDRFKEEVISKKKNMNPFFESDDENDQKNKFKNFMEYVYKNYLKRFKKINLAENKLINFWVSILNFKDEFGEIKLFYDFLELKYDELDLSCYLFLRSLLIDELKPQINKFNKKFNLDNTCSKMILNNYSWKKIKCVEIIQNIFKNGNKINGNKFINLFISWIKQEDKISTLCINDLIEFVLTNYKELRNNYQSNEKEVIESKSYVDGFLSMKKNNEENNNIKIYKESSPKKKENKNFKINDNNEINDKIINSQYNLINNLVESILNENDIFENDLNEISKSIINIIDDKLKEILKNISKFDKITIFKNLLIKNPTDEQMDLIEDLFIEYKNWKESNNLKEKDIIDFSKKILKIPEINDQVSQLISYILMEI